GFSRDWSSDVCSSDLVDHPRLMVYLTFFAAAAEDLRVFIGIRPQHVDLVVNPAHERLLYEVPWGQVCREDEECVERHRKLAAGVDRKSGVEGKGVGRG